MARPKLTPMQIRRLFCKHEPNFVTDVKPMVTYAPVPQTAKVTKVA